jgi:hypothetical protein
VLIAVSIAVIALVLPGVLSVTQTVNSTGKAGATLTGCSGEGTSVDSKGNSIGFVVAPGEPGSSPENPFVVDRKGTVQWSGTTDGVITDHSWTVSVYGIPVNSGGSKNQDQKTQASGIEKIKKYLPIPVVGLFHVTGELTGTGGTCTGDIWLKMAGSPVGTPVWFVGLAAMLAGLLAAYFALPSAKVM